MQWFKVGDILKTLHVQLSRLTTHIVDILAKYVLRTSFRLPHLHVLTYFAVFMANTNVQSNSF